MDFEIVTKVLLDTVKVDEFDYPQCDVLTFACDNDRYIDVDGKKYSPLINTIEDRLKSNGVSCVSISRITSTIKGDSSYGRVFSPEGSFARAMIAKRVKGLLYRNKSYPYSNMEEKIWDKILGLTKARAVVAILPSRELCSVCRRRGIWVADVQHGVIADEHYWYGKSFRESDPVDWLPNSFLVWDAGSQEVIAKWADKKGVAVEIIGNPWVDRFKSRNADDPIVNALASKYPIKRNEKPNVLLSLSWGGHELKNGYIHHSLEEFIIDSARVYNWKIRLHPNQIRGFATDEGRRFLSYYKKTFKEQDVEWRHTSDMPLPLLLSNTDLHVTWLSSVCMESAYFGVPSLVLSPKVQCGGSHESYYNYLIDTGYVSKRQPNIENIRRWFLEKKNSEKLPLFSDYSHNFDIFIKKVSAIAKISV